MQALSHVRHALMHRMRGVKNMRQTQLDDILPVAATGPKSNKTPVAPSIFRKSAVIVISSSGLSPLNKTLTGWRKYIDQASLFEGAGPVPDFGRNKKAISRFKRLLFAVYFDLKGTRFHIRNLPMGMVVQYAHGALLEAHAHQHEPIVMPQNLPGYPFVGRFPCHIVAFDKATSGRGV